MKRNRINAAFFIVCIAFLSVSAYAKVTNSLPATALQPYGRYLIDDNKNLELISTAVHFGFSFEGNEWRIFTSLPFAGQHNYLQYEMDGKYIKRFKVEGDTSHAIVLTASASGRHVVWIYKATEATTGAILIQKVEGSNIKSIRKPEAPYIEFIGNSITCGAAADASEIRCDSGQYHDHHNAYYAYGPRVARALGDNYIVSSVSGIGVYRNWNSDGPTMPQVYEKADLQENSTKTWNFKKYAPKVVSIALGTNDFSKGDGKKPRLPFDSAGFVSAYIEFVQLVKSKYPKAQIALLSSPMINGDPRITLQNCLTAVKQKTDAANPSSKPVALFFFEPMEPHGCAGHPSVEDHAILAQQLLPFFKKLL